VALTSPALVMMLAIVVAALLTAVLWWWPRLAGQGARPVLLRIVALCTLQLSVLSLIFAAVNRSQEFYASWSDLFGTDAGGGAIVATHYGSGHYGSGSYGSGHYGSGQTGALVTMTGSSAVTAPGWRRAPRGQLEAVRIRGQLSGLTAAAYIYLPAGYSGTSGPELGLPVVVVISNQVSSRSATAPYSAARLSATAAGQIAAGRLRPLILVMLPGQVGHGDQGCLNIPGGAQAATFFSQDVPAAVRSTYRVGASPSPWGLLGDSSGGYCALQLAMTSSAVFSAAALPPGSYPAPPGPAESGGSPQLRAQENLTWLLRHQPMQPISVLFAGPGRTAPFLALSRPPMYTERASLGSGQWPLSPVLDWIGHTLSRPSRAGG
jgi:enterochelin esterase-like enzyme